ncbi:MAG TPA: N-acetyltransferase [Rhizobiales bacterium]|nr:N-acetyltransferase [Hyphomicrobiales bacterium]
MRLCRRCFARSWRWALSADRPRRCEPNDPVLGEVLKLIQASFAYMESRIDPPSSMYKLTLANISEQCETGEVWTIGEPVQACIFLTYQKNSLYLGKMAVASEARGKGYGWDLIALAESRAKALGFEALELNTRIELLENHRIFETFGFGKSAENAHPGYDRPTYITMCKDLSLSDE